MDKSNKNTRKDEFPYRQHKPKSAKQLKLEAEILANRKRLNDAFAAIYKN